MIDLKDILNLQENKDSSRSKTIYNIMIISTYVVTFISFIVVIGLGIQSSITPTEGLSSAIIAFATIMILCAAILLSSWIFIKIKKKRR